MEWGVIAQPDIAASDARAIAFLKRWKRWPEIVFFGPESARDR